jgi:hypothetical protein
MDELTNSKILVSTGGVVLTDGFKEALQKSLDYVR